MPQPTEPERNMYDLFVIDTDKHPDHWMAWRDWYARALQRHFFPRVATTIFAWPPVNGEQVQAVLAYLRKVQDEVRAEAKAKKMVPPRMSPVPDIAPVHTRAAPSLAYRPGASA